MGEKMCGEQRWVTLPPFVFQCLCYVWVGSEIQLCFVEHLGFPDEQAALRFALAALTS